MKNLNKKILGASLALFMLPAFAYWEETQTTTTSSDTTMVSTTSVVNNVYLKWKIESYKVILHWEANKSEDVIWYKIVLTNPDWTQKTLSVWVEKNSLENWDAKPGKNVYQLFVMWEKWELAKSNEVVLNMWPNWWYDFWQNTQYSSWKTSDNNGEKVSEFVKEMEESIKELRESITEENLEEIKKEALSLKEEFLKKAQELWVEWLKIKVEYRFKVFFENQIDKKEEFKKNLEDKKEELKKLAEQKKQELWDKKEEYKKEFKDKKEELKEKTKEVKQTFKNKKEELKVKYKKVFEKKLEEKLASLSEEKINKIIANIDKAIEKYNSLEISQEQKDKFIAQLEALKELLKSKLDETQDMINLDELFTE